MYKTTTSLELHRLDRPSLQNPQKIFQSDEDSTTKSDAGEHHSAAPPVTSPLVTGTQYEFYPDLYMDMGSHRDPDSCCNGQVSMQPRPVSMDIVKRRSDISLVEDTYVLDPEEKMALGLPSLDRLPAFGSNFFLQLVTHVPPNSSPFNSPRSRTPLRSSAFSVESAEIQTAKKVSLKKPPTSPTLVFTNSLNTRSNSPRNHNPSRTRDRELCISDCRFANGMEVPRPTDINPERMEVRTTSTIPGCPANAL